MTGTIQCLNFGQGTAGLDRQAFSGRQAGLTGRQTGRLDGRLFQAVWIRRIKYRSLVQKHIPNLDFIYLFIYFLFFIFLKFRLVSN